MTDLEYLIQQIKASRKYGDTALETVQPLAEEALHRYPKRKDALKWMRKQLHNIMAPYLGDPDYEDAKARLTAVFTPPTATAQIRQTCYDLLHDHLSNRERLPIMETFYEQIFAVTGKPRTLLDLACALNPLAFPFMGLDTPLNFYAYDIHEPRIDLINHYFLLQGLDPLAQIQDIAHHPPTVQADVALFLKEMPRFSRNYGGGVGRPLLEALNVNWLVISYPTVSTHGGRNLTERYRQFMFELIDGHNWPVTELLFEGELVFCIQKR